jgi:serine/threonine protein kinase
MAQYPDFGKHYEILAEIGRGSSGAFYKVRFTPFNRLCAVKVSATSPVSDQTTLSDQDDFTGRVLAALANEPELSLPKLYSISGLGDRICFVWEFIDGNTLSELLSRKSIGIRAAVEALAGVARVVGRVHALGFAHGNLSPSNVLIAADRTAKLIGFGRVRPLPGSEWATAESPTVTAVADHERLQQLLTFCCSLSEQPVPAAVQALCCRTFVRAEAFSESLLACLADLPPD